MEWAEELFTLKKSAKKGRRAAAAASAASTPATVGGSGSSSSAGSAGADKPAADKPGSGTSITSIANSLEATDLNNGAAATAAAARPPRRTSGWSEETMAKASSKAGGVNNAIEQERFGRTAPMFSVAAASSSTSNRNSAIIAADDDDIPFIPDLDDLAADLDYSPTTPSTTTTAHMSALAATAAAGVGGVDLDAAGVAVNRVATYQALNSDLLKLGAFASLDGVDLSILTRCLADEADLVEPDEVWTWDGLFTEVSGDMHGEEEKPQADGGDAEKRRGETDGMARNVSAIVH